jgi:hypothetical protein
MSVTYLSTFCSANQSRASSTLTPLASMKIFSKASFVLLASLLALPQRKIFAPDLKSVVSSLRSAQSPKVRTWLASVAKWEVWDIYFAKSW